MATLAANTLRSSIMGDQGEFPVIASDIIYQGAAVGLVSSTGLARPLAAGDRFAGFAIGKADNSAGAASAINVNTQMRGKISLSVAGAVITDVGNPVYATDDNTFVFSPVGGVFVGYVTRFVSSGVVIVDYDVLGFADPFAEYSVREAVTGDKTLDSEDSGKLFWVTADAVITLPAVATPALCRIVNGGAYSTVGITISPNAADSLEGPDVTAADNKDVINTKATAKRGDTATLGFVDANGYALTCLSGTWAREA